MNANHHLVSQLRNALEFSIKSRSHANHDAHQKPSDVSISISEDLEFNASVTIDVAGKPHYNYNLGIVVTAHEVVQHLMCDPKFFPWLPFHGETVVESTNETSLRDIILDAYSSVDPQKTAILANKFLDSQHEINTPRRNFADFIVWNLITFVSYHEQAHYMWGHVHFHHRTMHAQTFKEFDADRSFDKLNVTEAERISFFMEHQADSLAFHSMFRDCIERAAHLENNPKVDFPFRELGELIVAATAGMQVALGVFEVCESFSRVNSHKINSIYNRTHPYSVSRMMHCYRIFIDTITSKTRDADEGHKINNLFLQNESMISECLGINEMSHDMVHDVVYDLAPDKCLTIQGADLFRYRHEGHDLFGVMHEYIPPPIWEGISSDLRALMSSCYPCGRT